MELGSEWITDPVADALMILRMIRRWTVTGFALVALTTLFKHSPSRTPGGPPAATPRVWDDGKLASLEVPLVNASASPVHISSDYYYRIPVRPIFRSYPVYRPDKEPIGYMDWLKQQEPKIDFDASKLKVEEDWTKAGEIVFNAPIDYDVSFSVTISDVRDAAWYERIGVPAARDGTVPFVRYVIRKRAKVELGIGACATCHVRVMPDGTLIAGSQGNFPYDRAVGFSLRRLAAEAEDQDKFLAEVRGERRLAFAAPWLQPDPGARVEQMSLEEIACAHEAVPPGAAVRVNTSLQFPPQIPNLIGVKDVRYFDHTGFVRHRGLGDLMRYTALVQGGLRFDRFLDFKIVDPLPAPSTQQRYSDEQLYALAMYLYSLKPPPNPNHFDALAARGEKVFAREGCALCHTPPLYSNNRLTPAEGFVPPPEHLKKFDILPVSVRTDPGLALNTREGSGYYKVPSLRGVWYRGPFEHNGSVATLEDWFDPRRLLEDYVPTGFRGQGVKTRPIKGHSFGLDLSGRDRKALIAFLKTL